MYPDRKTLGRTGEEAAVTFLKNKQYKILARNFRSRQFEIDIVAQRKKTIHFIEVKTRKSLSKGLPREAVTPAKQQKIIYGAQVYLQKNQLYDSSVQFDVIEVYIETERINIQLIDHAFEVN